MVTHIFEEVSNIDQDRQGLFSLPFLASGVTWIDRYACPVPFGCLDLESRLPRELEEESQTAEIAVCSGA
jgi:hypothetical protein